MPEPEVPKPKTYLIRLPLLPGPHVPSWSWHVIPVENELLDIFVEEHPNKLLVIGQRNFDKPNILEVLSRYERLWHCMTLTRSQKAAVHEALRLKESERGMNRRIEFHKNLQGEYEYKGPGRGHP